MKNLFIPHELAVIAKEKGFNEYCLGEYTKHAKTGAINLKFPKYEGLQGDWPDEHEINAPLYQQIIDWLREAHNIHFTNIEDAGLYSFTVKWHNGLYFIETSCKGGDYYEALINAIKKAFGLIESNTNIPPADETFDGSRI